MTEDEDDDRPCLEIWDIAMMAIGVIFILCVVFFLATFRVPKSSAPPAAQPSEVTVGIAPAPKPAP